MSGWPIPFKVKKPVIHKTPKGVCRTFLVTIETLNGWVSEKEMKRYIQSALEQWGGQGIPDDALWYPKVIVARSKK